MEGFSRAKARAYAQATDLHKKIRANFLSRFIAAGAQENSIVLLRGGSETQVYDTDTDLAFLQESYFHYLFGIEEAGAVGILCTSTQEVVVFIPELDPNLGMWFPIPTADTVAAKYGLKVHYRKDLRTVIEGLAPSVIYVNKGTNTDSGTEVPVSYFDPAELTGLTVDEELLYPVLTDCRVFKLPEEVAILHQAAKTASLAQVKVMQRCRAGEFEYQLATEFFSFVGNFQQTLSFNSVCSSGNHASILHYVHADGVLSDGDIFVSDQGSSLYGYKSDITCSFPVNGRFTEKQRKIYEAVLDAQRTVIAEVKPGVGWTDMHKLAERRILTHLLALGLVKGDIEAMLEARVGGIFMPHGLGHFLGLDTHDVGGYLHSDPRVPQLGLRSLRTRRVLAPGMYITVEPGCYFIDFLIDRGLQDATQSQFLNAEKVAEFRGFGGVRLEDDVLVTETGSQVLSKVPRTVEEVEAVMAGGEWAV